MWVNPKLAWSATGTALALLFAGGLFAAQLVLAQLPARVALVVGNAAYEHAAPLANPKNDAEDMAAVLEGLGFAVERAADLDYRAFAKLVLQFSKRTKGAEAALFYYAGHGLQVGGVNYLLPVDVALEDEMQLRFQTVDLDAVLRGMRSSANMVFLDACRDNPFVRSVARSMGTRSSAVGRGLARVENNAYGGAFIAFATAAGEVASDGEGRNSPFTAALKQHIGTPGLELNQVLNRVRRELAGIEQEPWATSSLVDDFYFSTRPSTLVPVSPPPKDLITPRLDPAEEMWGQIRTSSNAELIEEFMRSFPNSQLMPAARARLNELTGSLTIQAVPPNALIRITSPEMPYQDDMGIHAGEYEITIDAQGYAPFKQYLSVSGNTVYRVSLCKLEERTKAICEDREVTRYHRKKKTEEKSTLEYYNAIDCAVDDKCRYRYHARSIYQVERWGERGDWYQMQERYKTEFCERLKRRLGNHKGRGRPYICDRGNFVTGSLSLGNCRCSYFIGEKKADRCEVKVGWKCDLGDMQEPYTTTEQECRDEKSLKGTSNNCFSRGRGFGTFAGTHSMRRDLILSTTNSSRFVERAS